MWKKIKITNTFPYVFWLLDKLAVIVVSTILQFYTIILYPSESVWVFIFYISNISISIRIHM